MCDVVSNDDWLSQLLGHRVEELPVVDDVGAGWFRLGAPHDDHDTRGRIDVDVLAENSVGLERAVASFLRGWAWPPEVAVVQRIAVAQRLWRGRLLDPSLGKDLL